MKREQIFLEIVKYIHYIVYSELYLFRATKRQMDFTRKGKMSFTDYIFAIIKGTKSSLQASINAFLDEQNRQQELYSKQAFSQGRKRIRPEAFLELFYATVEKFYEKAETRKWREYHLLAIDGTRLNLPCTEELRELYGEQTSQGAGQVQALVSCIYDVLNGMLVDVRFAHSHSSERTAAEDMIRSFDSQRIKNPVFIMDRGYPSAQLIQTIMQCGYKCVMRCSSEFVANMQLSKQDNVLLHQFKKLKEPVQIRVVTIRLDDGTNEYLLTNLFEDDISMDDFYQLYHLRWGIECKYDDLKNKLQVENFTGYSANSILQDFYASMFLVNLAGALEFDCRDEVEALHNMPENKHQYRINRNMVISELKRSVIELLVTPSLIKKHKLLRTIQKRLESCVCPVRPGRSLPREVKHKSAKFSQNSKLP